jgi:hypothetical protein
MFHDDRYFDGDKYRIDVLECALREIRDEAQELIEGEEKYSPKYYKLSTILSTIELVL